MAGKLRRDEARVLQQSESPALTEEEWSRLVLLIDKPAGITSFDVIRRLRRVSPIKKIGHAGTLDPMATGLLICLCGRATKLSESFMEEDKVYSGTIRLGQTTPSYDADTPVDNKQPIDGISDAEIQAAAQRLCGDIRQLPPMYSAVKVEGERLYKKARRGESVSSRPPRQVSVMRFDVEPLSGSDVRFQVECSKGTYIRTLAHDMGRILGVGAHLVELRRVRSGSVSVEQAWPLQDLVKSLATGAQI